LPSKRSLSEALANNSVLRLIWPLMPALISPQVLRRSGSRCRHENAGIGVQPDCMTRRLIGLTIVFVLGAAWFAVSPLIGLSRLANAVAARNTSALDQRVDFARLGRSLAPQIVWAYLNKTGRAKMLGRNASALIAGGSASIADAILGDLLNPEAMLQLLDSGGWDTADLRVQNALAPFPKGDLKSLWEAFQSAEYGLGNFYVSLPASAVPAEQYRIRLQVLQWNWKLVAIDLPQHVRDQLADELIKRVGS